MINLAMVGLGWWGRKMTDVVQGKSAVIRFTRAVEPNIEAARSFAQAHSMTLSADLDDALNDPNIHGVVLATPHSLHSEQIERAAAAGKHIFCEKPLALNKAEAELSVARCKAAGLVLGMGHERRFEPPIAAIIEAADAGRLGRLLQIEANFSHDKFLSLDPSNWRLDPSHAPAGGMTATGIHLTDLSIRLMGPAQEVMVTCQQLVSKLPSGDTMSAYIRFRNGGSAYVSASLGFPFISRFAVFGSEGWVEVRDKAHVEAPDGWIVTKGLKGQPITVEEIGKAEPVLWNLEAFGNAVAGKSTYPISGEDLVSNIALLEAIVAASKSNQIESVA
eukprot:gene15626-15772_t